MEEIWKDIEGFEGLYQVSNLGNVKSLNYSCRGYAKNLTPKLNCKGYLWVILYNGSKTKCTLIHRLVGNAFLENPHNLPFINHKDENPLNNCVDNLEWCTGSYNVLYSLSRHPERSAKYKHPNYKRRNRKSGKPYKHTKQIAQYTKDGEIVATYANPLEASLRNGWRTSSLISCCEGKRKTAYGYCWQYAN